MSNSLRVRCTGFAALGDRALHRLQANFADLDGRVFGAGGRADAAHRSANAGDQFARAEGLGDVVVGAQLQRLHFFLFLVAHGQHEDGQPGSKGANAAQRLHAANARHVDVEQNRIAGRGAQHLQSLFAARGFGHLKAELQQRRPQRPADGRFVVDDKNANSGLAHGEHLFSTGVGIAAKNVVPSISSLVTQT